VTGTAQREAWQARPAPPVDRVRADLWPVPVPIPGSPLRCALAYLTRGNPDRSAVDDLALRGDRDG
jgi:hypothetical protein